MFKRIDLSSAEYPPLLREIKSPPKALYVRGELPHPDTPMIAVVGSRQCTTYGRQVARQLTEGLAHAGLVVVSGLAFGIDAIAHEAAIDGGSKTIAVLASSVNRVTPIEHHALADRILDHGGALISEIDPESPHQVMPFSFPIRNRIISGLCLGTLVVEATLSSGSIITAKLTNDQGRQLFAVPGPITSESSQGTNNMLKSEAHLVTSANDILDILGLSGVALERPPGDPIKADTKEEAIILPLLGKQPKHLDLIIRESGLSASVIGSAMTLMEIKGKVRHVGGNHYIIC